MTATESGAACVTLLWFLVIVHQHMRFQLIRIGEIRVAHGAFVWSIAGMDAQMTPQIGNLHKFTVTIVAVVWLFAGMQSHVRLQMMVACEAFVAVRFGTGKWLFARMRSLVIL